MKSRPRLKRLLRWIILLLVAAIVVLYIALPIGLGAAAVAPLKSAVGAPPIGFQAITLNTEDGVSLAAWYAPPMNGAAIILIHGAGGSRETVRGYAEMLIRHGYGVLAIDLRGHGESASASNRFGWQGTRDVGAAVAYLQSQSDVTSIGGLGLSLGGEVLLGAASAYPVLKAIIADGATQRCIEELTALPAEQPLYRNFTARVMYAAVQVLTGETPPKPLLASMQGATDTRFLLIAAGADELEVAFNELFGDTIGARAALWVAQDTLHTGAFSQYPDEYEQRVIEFFKSSGL
ncbi:MAG: alpha/beta fold hydrolase [Chloroflexi bacterium]|nr:alpha/beta fold hydrolase [Chloroflexota bacterium]